MRSTFDVVGWVTACNSPAYFTGDSSTTSRNGDDNAKNSHSEVVETTFTPAIFMIAHMATTASITARRR